MKLLTGITTTLLLIALTSPAQARRQAASGTETLSESDAATLLFMREEEKVARDVYLHFYELWGDVIFSNIAQAEQRHMDSILNQLNQHNLPDPRRGELH